MIKQETHYSELSDLVLGRQIGFGVYKDVFVFQPNTDLVIKFAATDPAMNYREWDIWNSVDKEIKKWLAPCVRISDCGVFLIQKRVERKPKKDYPKMIPAFLTDTKYSNFGWIDNKFVCCDYGGFYNIFLDGKPNTKLVKANWWGDY